MIVAILLLFALASTIQADEFGCKICQNLVVDFKDDLSKTTAQNVFDRICDDITGSDFKDYDKTCKACFI
jgi:hypothetical protein